MKTRILRFERGHDSLGNEEIFMQIEVTTDSEICYRGEWLTQEEISLINDNESNKTLIAQEMGERAVLAKNNEVTAAPPTLPSIDSYLN